jgi:hypothetical protein
MPGKDRVIAIDQYGMGLVKPNLLMLSAICRICFFE